MPLAEAAMLAALAVTVPVAEPVTVTVTVLRALALGAAEGEPVGVLCALLLGAERVALPVAVLVHMALPLLIAQRVGLRLLLPLSEALTASLATGPLALTLALPEKVTPEGVPVLVLLRRALRLSLALPELLRVRHTLPDTEEEPVEDCVPPRLCWRSVPDMEGEVDCEGEALSELLCEAEGVPVVVLEAVMPVALAPSMSLTDALRL